MRLIGLTGGIATGKSTVATELKARGAAVIDADLLAREVVEPGRPALSDIVEMFGQEMLQSDGSLDRPRLAALVFADENARHDLERITHPRVRDLMMRRIGEAIAADPELVVAEVPLLFETRSVDLYEGVMVAYAPPDVQIARVMARDGIDEHAARQRLAAQMPIDEKRERATWVIDNSDGIDATLRQVRDWWELLAAGQL
ncbi:MAG TPA: dephospho-CoA kinase [Candidatus Dormibacteraeota bacterium]